MKPNSLLRLGTVASFVVLLTAFVCYRAGAFSRFMESNASPVKTIMPSSKLHTIVIDPSAESPDVQPPTTSQERPSKTTERARTLMSGTKSEEQPVIVLPPGRVVAPEQ
jgi:hypothetical protein